MSAIIPVPNYAVSCQFGCNKLINYAKHERNKYCLIGATSAGVGVAVIAGIALAIIFLTPVLYGLGMWAIISIAGGASSISFVAGYKYCYHKIIFTSILNEEATGLLNNYKKFLLEVEKEEHRHEAAEKALSEEKKQLDRTNQREARAFRKKEQEEERLHKEHEQLNRFIQTHPCHDEMIGKFIEQNPKLFAEAKAALAKKLAPSFDNKTLVILEEVLGREQFIKACKAVQNFRHGYATDEEQQTIIDVNRKILTSNLNICVKELQLRLNRFQFCATLPTTIMNLSSKGSASRGRSRSFTDYTQTT